MKRSTSSLKNQARRYASRALGPYNSRLRRVRRGPAAAIGTGCCLLLACAAVACVALPLLYLFPLAGS